MQCNQREVWVRFTIANEDTESRHVAHYANCKRYRMIKLIIATRTYLGHDPLRISSGPFAAGLETIFVNGADSKLVFLIHLMFLLASVTEMSGMLTSKP